MSYRSIVNDSVSGSVSCSFAEGVSEFVDESACGSDTEWVHQCSTGNQCPCVKPQ